MKKLLKQILPLVVMTPMLILSLISTDNIIDFDKNDTFTYKNKKLFYKGQKYDTTQNKRVKKILINERQYTIPNPPTTDNLTIFTINKVIYLYNKTNNRLIKTNIVSRMLDIRKQLKRWTINGKTYVTWKNENKWFFSTINKDNIWNISAEPIKIKIFDADVVELKLQENQYVLLNLTKASLTKTVTNPSNKKLIEGKVFYIQTDGYILEDWTKQYQKTNIPNNDDFFTYTYEQITPPSLPRL